MRGRPGLVLVLLVLAVGRFAEAEQPLAPLLRTPPAREQAPSIFTTSSDTDAPLPRLCPWRRVCFLYPPSEDSSDPSPASTQDDVSTVAEATVPSGRVYDVPGASSPIRRLAHPQPSGAPLVFLVQEDQPQEDQSEWLKVLLPVRPNGSTGWIRRDEVEVSHHDYRIVVELSGYRITVYKGQEIFLQEPVGLGKANTPTPGGLYYIKELLQPPDPNTVYGPYAYGLSGFSNVLTKFGNGEGVIGIHGNNDPSTLGKDVSAGCIRMSNTGITKLANTLPLGVPVEIRT